MSNKGKPGHQGFAALSSEERRRIARQGGRAAAKLGKGHHWTIEEAREAGKIGGSRSRRGKAPRFVEEL